VGEAGVPAHLWALFCSFWLAAPLPAAHQVLGVKISLVSLVDENRQWFKAATGLAAPETSRDVSFCDHACVPEPRGLPHVFVRLDEAPLWAPCKALPAVSLLRVPGCCSPCDPAGNSDPAGTARSVDLAVAAVSPMLLAATGGGGRHQ